MNPFDSLIYKYLNLLARKSWTFDTLINLLSTLDLFKGGVIVACFWWLWFGDTGKIRQRREIIISTFLAATVALTITRVLTYLLPFSPRPIDNPLIDFNAPYGIVKNFLSNSSSIPSDHATLFFCLVTGIAFASVRLGVLAFFYTVLIICLPRIYCGYHSPTDILAGAFIGIVTACLFNKTFLREKVSRPFFFWLEKNPSSFYFCAFIVSYLVATLFDDIRLFTATFFEH